MKNIKIICGFIIYCCLSSASGFAQNVEFDKSFFPDKKDELKIALRNLKDGDKFYDMQQGAYYVQALEYYLEANKFNPNNAQLNYRIGRCYLYSIQKTKAIQFFEKALQLNPQVSSDVNYYLGMAYQLNYEFDKAIESYKQHKQKLSPQQIHTTGAEIEKKINECNTGKELVKNPVRVFIDNLGSNVNSVYADHSPIVNADESVLIFTSRKDNTTGGKKDANDFKYYEDIFVCYNHGGKWSAPSNPGEPLNTSSHDAIIGITPDGFKLLIYKGELGGDIYISQLEGNNYTKPRMLASPINLKESQETSASFSPDGRTLYFTSDRPGGYGGLDIYYSMMDAKGRWSEPVNLGPAINTKYDEDGVFMAADGKTMFFSSNGHKTMGGFDIFKTVFENGKWSEPENLGYPINGTDNDLYFTIVASGKRGYYSTEKTGGFGEDDIYMVTFLGPEKQIIINTEHNLLASLSAPISEKIIEKVLEIKSNPVTILKGKIFDEKSGNPVKASIELTDNTKNEVLAVFESNSSSGRYLVSLPAGKNYGIAIKAENYLFHSENFDIPDASVFREVIKDIALKNVEVGQKIVLNNIFFDIGKATLRAESYAELGILNKLLNDNPTLKIEISGHTDNKGSATLNQTLSENRAKAVVDYLISKGIDASRLRYAGYGPTRPIASNDKEEGRQQNRRTEFEILGK